MAIKWVGCVSCCCHLICSGWVQPRPAAKMLDRVELRHNKRLTRLNHRGCVKVNTQWNLYCMVHNIEKLAKTRLGW